MRRIASKVWYRVALLSAVVGVAGLAGACGDEGGSGTVFIVAAEGGVVEIPGDETSLSIPAYSLAEDTVITLSYGSLSSFGPLENGRDRVLLMEPAGTALELPATVVIDPGYPAITANQVVSVRQWMDGGWYGQREATVGSGGLVITQVSYLAPLAVVVEDPVVGPVGTITGSVYHLYMETPLEGYTFQLMQGATVVDTAVSDASGQFTFTDVPVGSYVVHADVTADENCYNDPVDQEAVVTESQNTDVWFGFVPGPC